MFKTYVLLVYSMYIFVCTAVYKNNMLFCPVVLV